MNLADIRKKALQEKEAGGVSPRSVVDSPATPPPVRDEPANGEPALREEAPSPREAVLPEPPSPLPVEAIVSMAAPELERAVEQEPVSFPGTMPPARPFDPLAELLAGRERAGSDDDGELSALVEGASSSDQQTEEYLCFRVADESYAISIMEIKEIIKPREVTEVPRVPHYVPGIVSLRGVIIPIYDLRRRLRLEDGPGGSRQRVLVVRHGDGYAGIQVDQVTQVVKLGEADEEQPPAVLDGTGREFVKGIGHHDGNMLILLDLEKILDLNLS